MDIGSRLRANIVFRIIIFLIILFGGIILYGTDSIFMILTFDLFVINIIAALFGDESKLTAVLFLISLFVLMVCTSNQNGQNGDYRAYESLYNHFLNGGNFNNISGYSADKGYSALMAIFSKTGLGYNFFRAFQTLISIILINKCLKDTGCNYSFILPCYALMTFSYDVFQIRFFLAYSIIIFGFRYVIIEKQKSILKYIVCVALAALVHYSMLFYLLYLLVYFKEILFKYWKVLVVCFVIGTVLLQIMGVSPVDLIYKVVYISRATFYLSSNITYRLNIYTVLAVIGIMLYYLLIISLVSKQNRLDDIKNLLIINCLSTILMPFSFVSLEFERYYRPILIINNAIISSEYSNNKKNSSHIFIIGCFIIAALRQYMMFGLTRIVVENCCLFK